MQLEHDLAIDALRVRLIAEPKGTSLNWDAERSQRLERYVVNNRCIFKSFSYKKILYLPTEFNVAFPDGVGRIEVPMGLASHQPLPLIEFVGNMCKLVLALFDRKGITDPKLRYALAKVLPKHAGLKLNVASGVVFVDDDFRKLVLEYQLNILRKMSLYLEEKFTRFLNDVWPDTEFDFYPVLKRLELSQDIILPNKDLLLGEFYHWAGTKLENRAYSMSTSNGTKRNESEVSSRINTKHLDVKPRLKKTMMSKSHKANLLLMARGQYPSFEVYKTKMNQQTVVDVYFDSSHRDRTKVTTQLISYPYFADHVGRPQALVRVEPSIRTEKKGQVGETIELIVLRYLHDLLEFSFSAQELGQFKPISSPFESSVVLNLLNAVDLSRTAIISLCKGMTATVSCRQYEKLGKTVRRVGKPTARNVRVKLCWDAYWSIMKSRVVGLNPDGEIAGLILEDDKFRARNLGIRVITCELANDLSASLSKIKARNPQVQWAIQSDRNWHRDFSKLKKGLARDKLFQAQLKYAMEVGEDPLE